MTRCLVSYGIDLGIWDFETVEEAILHIMQNIRYYKLSTVVTTTIFGQRTAIFYLVKRE